MALFDRAIARLLPAVPDQLVQRISSRYIAGETVAEACRTVKQLNEQGKMATIDVLGEEISTAEAALEIVGAYHDVFEAIQSEHLDSNVSVKLTGLGLARIRPLQTESPNRRAPCGRERQLRAHRHGGLGCTSDTLRMYRELREEGLDNVGVVLQAYLRRTIRDIRELAPLRPNIRLCKGIYIEPPLMRTVTSMPSGRTSCSACASCCAARCVGIATHDKWLISEGQRLVAEHGLKPEEYEFQMLLGVTPAAGDRLIHEGDRLRVYVPFGKHWYSYSMRRLQENPKIAGYIAGDTVDRLFGRNGA